MDSRESFEAWARQHHSMREEDWFVESPNLADALPDSFAAWQAATDRAAKICEQTGEVAADMYGDGAECLQTAEMCAAAIRS